MSAKEKRREGKEIENNNDHTRAFYFVWAVTPKCLPMRFERNEERKKGKNESKSDPANLLREKYCDKMQSVQFMNGMIVIWLSLLTRIIILGIVISHTFQSCEIHILDHDISWRSPQLTNKAHTHEQICYHSLLFFFACRESVYCLDYKITLFFFVTCWLMNTFILWHVIAMMRPKYPLST